MRFGQHVAAGDGGTHVVDADVDGGDDGGRVHRRDRGHAAQLIQERGDHAACDHTGLGIADEVRAIRHAAPYAPRLDAASPQARARAPAA